MTSENVETVDGRTEDLVVGLDDAHRAADEDEFFGKELDVD